MSFRHQSRWVVVVLLILSAGLTAIPVSAVTPTDISAEGSPSTAEPIQVAMFTSPENNTTVPRHDHPETRSKSDLQTVERWLAGKMGEMLVDCTKGAQARKYGACDLDSEYPDWLDKYVDVARETETERDDRMASAFDNAQDNQREFNRDIQHFWETYEAYQDARKNGDTARARQLARNLRRLAPEINRTGATLTSDYHIISNSTEADLTAETVIISELSQNVTAKTAEVERESFVGTRLTVRANRTHISFLNPVGVEGQLTTSNGSTLSDRAIRLTVGGKTIHTRTDTEGTFRLAYRPTTLPLDTTNVTVRYVPRNESVYLPSTDTVPVSVNQVEPTVTVTGDPAHVSFEDRLIVTGRVAADGVPAAGVPVWISLGEEQRAVVQTDANGRYSARLIVPALISAGQQQIVATVPLESNALARTTDRAAVTVTSTETGLTVNGAQQEVGERHVRVNGTLTTSDGIPIPDQEIQLVLNGSVVANLQTNTLGEFVTVVEVPEDKILQGSVVVVAKYGGEKSHLQSTRVTTSVPLRGVEGQATDLSVSSLVQSITALTWWEQTLTGLLGGTVVGVLVFAWMKGLFLQTHFRRIATALPVIAFMTDGEAGREAVRSSHRADYVEEKVPTTKSVSPLEHARQQLTAGHPDSAVQTAYTAVRNRGREVVDATTGATHWEFYVAIRDGLSDEEAEVLRHLTEVYETAAFAPTNVSVDRAHATLDKAADLYQGSNVCSDGGQPNAESDIATD